jgi:hypothetical protein
VSSVAARAERIMDHLLGAGAPRHGCGGAMAAAGAQDVVPQVGEEEVALSALRSSG